MNISKDIELLQQQNSVLDQQLRDIQDEGEGFIEGKYTLVMDLSSSVYLNRIPAKYEKLSRFEDVNGVRFFDVTENGIHYRFVEGHIEWPQLALYAPNMNLEIVGDSKLSRGE